MQLNKDRETKHQSGLEDKMGQLQHAMYDEDMTQCLDAFSEHKAVILVEFQKRGAIQRAEANREASRLKLRGEGNFH